jgi:hypothetical protein
MEETNLNHMTLVATINLLGIQEIRSTMDASFTQRHSKKSSAIELL